MEIWVLMFLEVFTALCHKFKANMIVSLMI